MINRSLVQPVQRGDRCLWRTLAGGVGHPVYGPYVLKASGVYQVDFELALFVPRSDDIACATLEVTTAGGDIVLADRPIRVGDVSTALRRFSLLVLLRDKVRLEFRVAVHNDVELLVDGDPQITRISSILDAIPSGDLAHHQADLAAFGRDSRRIMRALTPLALRDVGKVRLGEAADGGYVCIDDFSGYDTAFSFGIHDGISWDRDAADLGLTIHQFDHTVTDPAPDDRRMVFEAKQIARTSGSHTQSLGDLIRRYDKGRDRPNIILKMDIEGAEWDVFDATSGEALSRLGWIVCELHYFQGLVEREHRDLIDRALQKLSRRFAAVHVHSNVWGGYSNIANTVIPNVIEVTFANRAIYALTPGDAVFPGPLDQSCDASQPDFHLGTFAF